jgi:hypothetical protein
MYQLLYIIKKNIKNSLLDLKNNPAKLILYIFFISIISLLFIFSSIGTEKSYLKNGAEIFRAISVGLCLLSVYVSITAGIKKGNSFFKMSDVNLIFTAPISPQEVLIYGIIKQLLGAFIMMILIIFQLPNICRLFNIKQYGSIWIVIGMFLLSFSTSIITVIIYSLASLSAKYKKLVSLIINITIFLIVIGFLFKLFTLKSIDVSLLNYLNMDIFKYIPFIGWISNIITSAIDGNFISATIYTTITIAGIFILLYLLSKMNLDYYEDAMLMSEHTAQIIEKAKNGMYSFSNNKSLNVRKIHNGFSSFGPKTIFEKQLLEYRKQGAIFWDKKTLIVAVAFSLLAFFVKGLDLRIMFYLSIYLLLIFSQNNKWNLELKKHFIYLIPYDSKSKIIFSTAIENIKNIIDGFIIFIPVCIVLKESILLIPLCSLAYASFGCLFIYFDMTLRKFFGLKLSRAVEQLLKLLFLVLIIMPGILLSIAVIYIQFSSFPKAFEYLIIILYNLFISYICIIGSKRLFETIQMR